MQYITQRLISAKESASNLDMYGGPEEPDLEERLEQLEEMAKGKEYCMEQIVEVDSNLGADQLARVCRDMYSAMNEAKQCFEAANFYDLDQAKEYTLLKTMMQDLNEMSNFANERDNFQQQVEKFEAEKNRLPSRRPDPQDVSKQVRVWNDYTEEYEYEEQWYKDDSEGERWANKMHQLDSNIQSYKQKHKQADQRVHGLATQSKKNYKNAQEHKRNLEKNANAEAEAEQRKWHQARDERKKKDKERRDAKRQKAEEFRSGCAVCISPVQSF